MSTPFLEQFAYHVVAALVARDLLIVRPGAEAAVVQEVAARLARAQRASLVSTLSAALLAAEGVEELFADDERLKGVVDDLPPSVIHR